MTLIANVHGVLAPKAGNVKGNVSTFSVGKYFLYWNNHKHKQDLAFPAFYRYITFLNVLNIFNKKNTKRKRHIIQYMTMTCVVVVHCNWSISTIHLASWNQCDYSLRKKRTKTWLRRLLPYFLSEKQTVCAVL